MAHSASRQAIVDRCIADIRQLIRLERAEPGPFANATRNGALRDAIVVRLACVRDFEQDYHLRHFVGVADLRFGGPLAADTFVTYLGQFERATEPFSVGQWIAALLLLLVFAAITSAIESRSA